MDPSLEAQTSSYTIIVSEKGGASRRETFDLAELNIGRVQGNELVLAKGNVSKRHAKLLFSEGRVVVSDLNSTNGTYVNRRRISQATIVKEGDRVYIGDYVLRVDLGALLEDEDSETVGRPTFATSPDRASEPSHPGSADLQDRATHPPEEPSPEEPSPFPSIASGPPSELPPEGSYGSLDSEPPPEHSHELVQALSAKILADLKLERIPLEVPPELAAKIRQVAMPLMRKLARAEPLPEGVSLDDIAEWTINELLEYGPITRLLEDPDVSSVALPRRDQLLVTRREGVRVEQPSFSSEASLRLCIERLAASAGEPVRDVEQVIDRRLKKGVRLSAVVGAAAPGGALLVLRKPRSIALSLGDLVRRGVISRQIAVFLEKCVAARLNLLVVGPRDEGASFLLSGLCAAADGERIIALSDLDDVVAHTKAATRMSLSASGEDSSRLLRIVSRIPGARLVATLSSPEVAAATVEAIGDGIEGVLVSLRSPDLKRALSRLPADIAVARPGMTLEASREWVHSSFDLAIEVARQRDGRIRLLRISEFLPNTQARLEVSDIFTFVVERVASGGAIEGSFTPSGALPRIAERMRAMSVSLDGSLFSRPPSR